MAQSLKKALEELHSASAERLLEIITKGVPVTGRNGVERDADGEIVYEPAPASYFNAAIALLRQNGIEVDPDEEDSALHKLKGTVLPFASSPEGHDEDDDVA